MVGESTASQTSTCINRCQKEKTLVTVYLQDMEDINLYGLVFHQNKHKKNQKYATIIWPGYFFSTVQFMVLYISIVHPEIHVNKNTLHYL